MPAKRQMLIEIGKYKENEIIKAIEKKGMGLKNPEFLIPNILEELQSNNGNRKKSKIIEKLSSEEQEYCNLIYKYNIPDYKIDFLRGFPEEKIKEFAIRYGFYSGGHEK